MNALFNEIKENKLFYILFYKMICNLSHYNGDRMAQLCIINIAVNYALKKLK